MVWLKSCVKSEDLWQYKWNGPWVKVRDKQAIDFIIVLSFLYRHKVTLIQRRGMLDYYLYSRMKMFKILDLTEVKSFTIQTLTYVLHICLKLDLRDDFLLWKDLLQRQADEWLQISILIPPGWYFLCGPHQATDPDLGTSGQVHYRLVNHQKLFSINATGAIRTTVPLDREVRGRSYGLKKERYRKFTLDNSLIFITCHVKGERSLLSDRGGLGWWGGSAAVQTDTVSHSAGCGR